MKMKFLCLYFFIHGIAGTVAGQDVRPEYLDVPDRGGKFIKQDADGYYFSGQIDSTNTVFFSKNMDYYKLSNKKKKTIEAGGLIETSSDYYRKEGKWVKYYRNGKVNYVKYYRMGNLTGTVDSFYANGKIALKYNIVPVTLKSNENCLAGLYQEFYTNGKLKTEGIYSISTDSNRVDTINVTDPVTGVDKIVVSTVKVPYPEKVGLWRYYNEAGQLLKSENYY